MTAVCIMDMIYKEEPAEEGLPVSRLGSPTRS